jgi:hypothetical protein
MNNLSAQILSHLQTFPGATDGEIERAVEFSETVRERLEDQDTLELTPRGKQTLRECGYFDCDECKDTGWRTRETDDAPIACIFCDVSRAFRP